MRGLPLPQLFGETPGFGLLLENFSRFSLFISDARSFTTQRDAMAIRKSLCPNVLQNALNLFRFVAKFENIKGCTQRLRPCVETATCLEGFSVKSKNRYSINWLQRSLNPS